MWKKTALIIGAFALACGLAIIIINTTVSADGEILPLELVPLSQDPDSIDPGGVQIVFLEPFHPDDLISEQEIDQGERVNGIVLGPSDEIDRRCLVYLEPIQPGENSSKVLDVVCTAGPVGSIGGMSLDSSYLIAKFYNWTGYAWLLVEYYGSLACSPTISYGVVDLPDSLDNKFASGKSYSDCDQIQVYDFNNYSGAAYSCGASCSSFYALNDHVSSWRVRD